MKQQKSLYQRLGGYDAIAAIVAEHGNLMHADPRFARFSGGRSTDRKQRSTQLNIDYMCKITGGTHYYMGRDMKTSHAGLGITRSEWVASMKHWETALDRCEVSSKEKREVLSLLDRMRDEIVE